MNPLNMTKMDWLLFIVIISAVSVLFYFYDVRVRDYFKANTKDIYQTNAHISDMKIIDWRSWMGYHDQPVRYSVEYEYKGFDGLTRQGQADIYENLWKSLQRIPPGERRIRIYQLRSNPDDSYWAVYWESQANMSNDEIIIAAIGAGLIWGLLAFVPICYAIKKLRKAS